MDETKNKYEEKEMPNVSGFDTLKIEEYNGKFYIYSWYDKTTIGPVLYSVEELEKYAKENYLGSYV